MDSTKSNDEVGTINFDEDDDRLAMALLAPDVSELTAQVDLVRQKDMRIADMQGERERMATAVRNRAVTQIQDLLHIVSELG